MRAFRIQPVLFGCVVVALGVVWLLRNLGIVQVDVGSLIATYWPIIFVIWGLDALLSGVHPARTENDRARDVFRGTGLIGLVFLAVGLLILGRNLGLFWMDFSILWGAFWPAVIILIGWGLIRGASGSGGTHWAVMSAIERKGQRWRLEDGNYIAFMGGVELDLTAADIPDRQTVLNLTAVMGAVDVKVPPDLEVECDGSAFLGGVTLFDEEAGGVLSSRTAVQAGPEGSPRRLVIHSRALLGGIEVKRA